jgi:NADPH:quinone reductase-like Zn-dependent oxidoreductase
MKSWFVTGKTGFDSLELKDVPVPEVRDKDVLVKCKFTR